MSETWYFERVKDQWHLHTPGYTPEVSFKVAQTSEGQVIHAFHKGTTLTQSIKDIIIKMLPYLNLYGPHLCGFTRVEVNQGQVEAAARNVEKLQFMLLQKKEKV